MSLETNSFEFSEFLLDGKEKVLLQNGTPLSITPKAFELLRILIENHGHLVERDKLLKTVWADSFVEEGNLTFTIGLLRKTLGDDKKTPRFIETVPKRGYRFIGKVINKTSDSPSTAKIKQNDFQHPTQKPYFLLSVFIISLICLFGIAFVWYKGDDLFLRNESKLTRLTNSGKATIATVSPNGEFIVFAQKDGVGESLWWRNTNSGAQKQILPPEEVEYVGLTISPDNRFAYFTVFGKNVAISNLTRLSLEDGGIEKISAVEMDVSASFSPDGKKFAFTESFSSLKETHLIIANSDGSNQQVLKKGKSDKRVFPTYKASPVAWSPDGETIACAVQEFEKDGSFYRLLLVNPLDGSEKYLSEKRWEIIENVVWKDAENLVVVNQSANQPISQLWQVARKTGEAKQLTNDAKGYQSLSSSNGNLFTIQKDFFSSLHIANFVENTDSFQSKQILGEAGLIENSKWSREGKIFYNSWNSGKNEIWQINADGTIPQQLTFNSDLVYSFTTSANENAFVFSSLQNGKIRLSIADSKGQNIRPLTDGSNDILPVFAPNGKTVVFQKNTTPPTLWQIAPESNSSPTQLTGYLSSHPTVSPDGQKIAFHFIDYGNKNPQWKLGIINVENRQLINKLEFPFPITERKTVWYPKNNLLTMIFNKGEDTGILFLSATDGKFWTINNIGTGKITDFDWTTDGSRLVFSQNFETSDVVSFANF